MKITVTMKNPDALPVAIQDALDGETYPAELDDEELEGLKESRTEKLTELCGKWLKYGEYLTVVIDTEADTCIVVKNKS